MRTARSQAGVVDETRRDPRRTVEGAGSDPVDRLTGIFRGEVHVVDRALRSFVVAAPTRGSMFAKRYRIEHVLGQGGMGVVVAARDEKTGVRCAIKLLGKEASRTDTPRLMREARALMLLTSEHVVRIFDVGEDASAGPYLVLERLDGRDLAKLAPLGTPLPWSNVAAYAHDACRALAHAHAIGIIHRDIKPSNLFLARTSDGREIVKVLDFGVSKLTASAGHWEGQRTLTGNGGDGALGSPQFISPEQLADPRGVDARTDLWSMGVVMFRLLTGRFPFEGTTVAEIFNAVLRAPIPSLDDTDVPPALAAIVMRCLTRDVDGRIATAEELANALECFARQRTASCAPVSIASMSEDVMTTETTPCPPRARTRNALRAIGAVAAGVALTLLAVKWFERAPSPATSTAPAIGSSVVAAPASSGVELTVHADAPIVALRVLGLRRMEVDGASATLLVTPWTGALAIEADLEDGARARVETYATDGREIKLATTVRATRPTSKPSAVVPAPRTSPKRAPAPALPSTPPATTAPSGLRSNPYY
jgi:eukaryotic-like serine/threonine-protein kinase